jgi:hypothetical protein
VWRAAAPVAVLALVATAQIAAAKVALLTPWKGGGFGMFSTIDSADRRHVEVVVSAPDRSEAIDLSGSLEDASTRAAALPTDGQLRRLSRLVVERERRHGRPVRTVRVRCWRTVFARHTLQATRECIRDVTFDAGSAGRIAVPTGPLHN